MECFFPDFLSRSSWWIEENVFPEIHWPLYYSEKLDISIGDTENEGRVSCLLGQRKQDLKHVLLKTLQSYHGSRAQSHTNWNYWLGLWASFHNHFTFVLHGNKMSSQSSLSLCKEHCPITLQQAHILFEVSLKPLWLVSLEGAKSANFSGMALNGLLDTGVLVIAVLLIVHPGSFFVKIWATF